jgi:hypothetical protein
MYTFLAKAEGRHPVILKTVLSTTIIDILKLINNTQI